MNKSHVERIGAELKIPREGVRSAAELIEGGATVPFIARYRKEATGSLDEVAVTHIRDRLAQLVELDDRRESILGSLRDRDLLTDDLNKAIDGAQTMTELEDIYLPYRPKRRTRATIAREKGLEPLASMIWAQGDGNPWAEASAYLDSDNGVDSEEQALAGARDIMAEWISEDAEARSKMRVLYAHRGVIRSRVQQGKESEAAKYRDYFEWEELLTAAPSHRVLAMLRGEKEGWLAVHIEPSGEAALDILEETFVRGDNPLSEQVRLAVRDGHKRLLAPSMETEYRNLAKARADQAAIQVFADNLRQLLLAAPLGAKNVMALDPGFRTGAKVVCLDRQGKMVHNDTVYPLLSEKQAKESAKKLSEMCKRYNIEAIAVGNGTAGRETEAFLRGLDLGKDVQIVMVNESGASIYSASDVAREEFPDHDLTVRGAVSIGRRLLDPLAELVKIEPKSIGVGQYQHDVDQGALRNRLDDVVTSAVNSVGVEVNTSSKQLLTYVSGLGPQLAANIVKHRDERGPFKSRAELKKVSRLGPKAFEQAAGFLRVRDGHPLDASGVHPERYKLVDRMARDLSCKVEDLLRDADLRENIDLSRYVGGDVGMPTLNDIVEELAKPGRDPRDRFEAVTFAEGVNSIGDVRTGMKLPGIVTNITAFGAFVDVGVHQDGLVHISQLADRFVRDPNEIVKLGQTVNVTVLDVDIDRKRISLSMKAEASP